MVKKLKNIFFSMIVGLLLFGYPCGMHASFEGEGSSSVVEGGDGPENSEEQGRDGEEGLENNEAAGSGHEGTSHEKTGNDGDEVIDKDGEEETGGLDAEVSGDAASFSREDIEQLRKIVEGNQGKLLESLRDVVQGDPFVLDVMKRIVDRGIDATAADIKELHEAANRFTEAMERISRDPHALGEKLAIVEQVNRIYEGQNPEEVMQSMLADVSSAVDSLPEEGTGLSGEQRSSIKSRMEDLTNAVRNKVGKIEIREVARKCFDALVTALKVIGKVALVVAKVALFTGLVLGVLALDAVILFFGDGGNDGTLTGAFFDAMFVSAAVDSAADMMFDSSPRSRRSSRSAY